MNFKNIVYIFTISCLILVTMNAEAIPAFTRKTNMACSTCHTAWPALNSFGRQYKEHGYRLGHLEAPTKTITKDLKWDETLPVSLMLVGRPYDKKKNGKHLIRALHEVELMIAGPMGDKFSAFVEIEAEDENQVTTGIQLGIPVSAFSYNYSEAMNMQLSWGENTNFDPYQSYTVHRRMTRSTNAVIGQNFGGADNGGSMATSRQNISIYGRPMPKLFYGASLSGDAKTAEGDEGNTVTLRVVFDVMPTLSIGALAVNGTCTEGSTNCAVDRKYSRSGLDVQSEIAGFIINAVALTAKDDNATATSTTKNNAYYVQAMYTAKEGVRTTWAPLIRFDSYDKNDGAEKVNEVTLGANYYLTENVRTMLEYWSKDSDISANDDNRLTLQVFAAF